MCADACSLPFPTTSSMPFYSLGVIEHIRNRPRTLYFCDPDYWEKRKAYARELLRVTKEGGRIIVACRTKVSLWTWQHGPTDSLSPKHHFENLLCEKPV